MCLLILGGVLLMLSCLLLPLSSAAVLVPTLIYILGSRVIMANATAGALTPFPKNSGTAAAVMGCILMLGSGLVSFIHAMSESFDPLSLGVTFLMLGSIGLVVFIRSVPPFVKGG